MEKKEVKNKKIKNPKQPKIIMKKNQKKWKREKLRV
jgi:hypothetical protein